MPLNLNEWSQIAAVVSAMCDVVTTGRGSFDRFFASRSRSRDAMQRAATLQQAMST